MDEQVVMPEPDQDANKSFIAQVIGVFSSPANTFKAILRDRHTLLIIVLVGVIAAASAYVQTPYQAELQVGIMQQSTSFELTQEMIESMTELTTFGIVKTMVGAFLLGTLLMLVVVTALALFTGNIIFGGQANFKSIWCVATYSSLIGALGNIIRTILIVAKGSMNVSTGLGILMPSGTITSISYMLFSFFDFFLIWEIIVLGIGISVLYGFSKAKGVSTAIVGLVPPILLLFGLAIFGLKMAGVPLSW